LSEHPAGTQNEAASTDQADQSLVAWNRRGALEEISFLKEIRASAWDQHTHAYKWLTASLLAINGAACLTILNYSELEIIAKLISLSSFVFGILCALAVAVLGQYSVRKSFLPVQRRIGYWMTVVEDGVRDEEIETKFEAEIKSLTSMSYLTQIIGWMSAIAFLIGVITAGAAMFKNATAPKANVTDQIEFQNG
jgi:hypothetical protein